MTLQTELEPRQVADGVWCARTIMSVETISRPVLAANAYLVVDEGEAAFVDTAWWYDAEPSHLEAVLDLAGVEPSAVHTVVLTHAHRDHSGFVDHLASYTGASVWLHRAEHGTVRAMAGNSGLGSAMEAEAWYRSFGFPDDYASHMVSSRIEDTTISLTGATWGEAGERIRVGDRTFDILATPGHTDGHVGLFERATGLLFAGDALLPRGHGNPHVTCRPLSVDDPLTAYVEGLRKLRRRRPRLCLAGHGPPVDDPVALIDAHLDYVDTKLDVVAECLDAAGSNAFDVARRLPWRGGRKRFDDLVHDELFLAFGDALARLRRLVTLGRATVTDDPVPLFLPRRST